MKKNYLTRFMAGLTMISLLVLPSCSDNDDETPLPGGKIGLQAEYTTDRCKVLLIEPTVQDIEGYTLEWTMTNEQAGIKDSIIGTNVKLGFVTLDEGTYNLTLTARKAEDVVAKTTKVTVKKESTAYSAYINKVYEFRPAPGQFVNEIPQYAEGDTEETMLKKAEDMIKGKDAGLISLGGFGGYVVFGFDHTIVNVRGKRDFRVKGNAFWAGNDPANKGGNSEPGVIMVSFDSNGNGLPDDEWYEIAGSENTKGKVRKDYEITYFRPDANTTDDKYIKWADSEGKTGYIPKNIFHSQNYFPEWIKKDRISFTGTLLPQNGENKGTETEESWIQYAFDFGYADNYPNSEENSAIDIDWATDSNGRRVNLPGVNFVRVHTGVNQVCGWLGETSTEVTGAEDLHLLQ